MTLAVVVAAAAVLTGCSPAPSHDDVAERFVIELVGVAGGIEDDWTGLADDLATDALSGRCGSDAYRVGLEHDNLVYAWDVVCSMYFKGDMSDAQIDRAKLNMMQHMTE